MKKSTKYILPFLVLVAAAFIGYFLLVVAYCIPSDTIKRNVSTGVQTILVEGAQFEYAEGYKSAILDNTTDAIILGETVYPTENPIKDALSVPRFMYSKSSEPENSLMGYINNNMEEERSVVTYPRYWHGYLVFTKVFFWLFDFADSRIIHMGLQLIVFAWLLFLFMKNNLNRFVIPLTLVFVLWNPISTGMCMQYYPCLYISTLAIIIMLHHNEFLSKDSFYYYLFFLIIGICTSYFDFLTYPVVTLGLPLCVWLVLRIDDEKKLVRMIFNSLFWALGYLGMWTEKWILSSFVLGENIVKEAITNVISRTSTSVDAENISRIETIIKLFRALFKWPYLIYFGVPFLLMLFGEMKQVISKQKDIQRESVVNAFLFLLISFIPLGWFFITANHSYVHPRLVYRNWGVTLFAGYAGMICLFSKGKDNK